MVTIVDIKATLSNRLTLSFGIWFVFLPCHAMSNFLDLCLCSVHCIINCRTRPGPCTNRPPSSYFAFGFVLCQCHHALKTHKTNLRPLLNHQHINVYF